MKKTLLLLALLPACLWAQDTDTAALIVRRYATMLNHEALPHDSTLVLETTISYLGQADTFVMRRWYAQPGMMRVEVRRGDSLVTGFCTNGTSRYRQYSRYNGWWHDLFPADFAHQVAPYDFRNAIHPDDTAGIRLTYTGTTTLKGETLQVVRAEQRNTYIRHFLFEKNSGLLLFIIESDRMPEGSVAAPYSHTEWKAIHEYTPLGTMLYASQESYRRDGLITLMYTTARFEPRNTLLFNQD